MSLGNRSQKMPRAPLVLSKPAAVRGATFAWDLLARLRVAVATLGPAAVASPTHPTRPWLELPCTWKGQPVWLPSPASACSLVGTCVGLGRQHEAQAGLARGNLTFAQDTAWAVEGGDRRLAEGAVHFRCPQQASRASADRALGPGRWHAGKSPRQLLYELDQAPRSALAEVHRQRRDLLRQACSRHSRRPRALRPEELRHVLVDDAHGLLYCYVPKVACTNWKRVLLALRARARGDARADPRAIPAGEAHAPGRLPSLADFRPAEIRRRLRDYLAFLFVREPFERLASAYRNKFARPYSEAFQRRYGTRIVRRLRPRAHPEALARGHDVRFAEFLAYLLDPRTRRDEPFNEHWERAHALCHPCRLRYDVVGRFETLAQDADFLLGLLGAPGLRFPAAPPPRAAPAREQAARLFRDISPFYQRRLFDLYKLDFVLFNYSAPPYLRPR
ncbi:carbohydrate sulfotransferase 13-like [Dipodomys merriami]|uniref:carbohydrate sulfotransferase 13-like n=1 Tax=Dipodomys merriami TaxID=94247 RepID=UPI00384B5A73